MRILIPILGFGRAGGYRVLSEMANAWTRAGHRVTFLCPDSSEPPYFPTVAQILWVSGSGRTAPETAGSSSSGGLYNLKALFRGLRNLEEDYDVVLANHSLTAWPVAIACRKAKRKFYYVQAYEPEYYVGRGTLKGIFVACIAALSYHLPLFRVVNSPIYYRYRNLRAGVHVPPGIDNEHFRPTEASENRRTEGTFTIGCIGRSEPEKGIRYVLEAFEELHKRDQRFELKVAFGNLPAGWEHPRAEVVTPRSDSELADFYRALDVLVAPGTTQHGAPHYPVLEGLACGVAVVTTGYLGATEANAWIVANRSVSDIVMAIRQIQAQPSLGAAKAKLFDANAYRWDAVAHQMQSLFHASSRTSAFKGANANQRGEDKHGC